MANQWTFGLVTANIVNDASCLIDIRKGDLLAALVKLPYQLIVPLPVRESEVLDFSDSQWRRLEDAGMITYDLKPAEVERALVLSDQHPTLSANDCFCYVTAETHAGILLTGDRMLRKIASQYGIELHGVLWIVDELLSEQACASGELKRALCAWKRDDSVFLPDAEIERRLVRM